MTMTVFIGPPCPRSPGHAGCVSVRVDGSIRLLSALGDKSVRRLVKSGALGKVSCYPSSALPTTQTVEERSVRAFPSDSLPDPDRFGFALLRRPGPASRAGALFRSFGPDCGTPAGQVFPGRI